MSSLPVLVGLVAEQVAVGLHAVHGGLDALLARVAFGTGVDVETVKVLHVIFGDERLQKVEVDFQWKTGFEQFIERFVASRVTQGVDDLAGLQLCLERA